MLTRGRRQRTNIKPTLGEGVVLTGIQHAAVVGLYSALSTPDTQNLQITISRYTPQVETAIQGDNKLVSSPGKSRLLIRLACCQHVWQKI